MRIGLIIPHFRAAEGGAEGFAVTVARELEQRGHEIVVVAEDGEGTGTVQARFVDLAFAEQTMAEFAPDVTIDWGLNAPANVHRLGGGVHGEYLRLSLAAHTGIRRTLKRLEHLLAPKHRRLRVIESHLINDRHTRFLAVSEFVAEQLRRTADISEDRITVLRNGVDIQRFAPDRLAALRAPTRAELGLAESDVAFLFVAHNLGLKNFRLLAGVFASLHAQLPQLKLVLLGRKRPRTTADWLICAAACALPERYYAAADVLLHPTYYDACANVVLEALAAGLPVVSSDRNGSAEILTSGENGIVLPVAPAGESVERQWAEQVRRLCENADLRRELGTAARTLVQEHSIQRYAEQLEQYLAEVVAQITRQRA